jgi:uncharacterized Zn finger protein (UPF0148 family)
MIQYKCTHCKMVIETDDSNGYTVEACPNCGGTNNVPPSKAQEHQRKEQERAARLQQKEQERATKDHQRELIRQAKEQEHQAAEQRRREKETLAITAGLAQEKAEAERKRDYDAAVQQAKANPAVPKIWYCQPVGGEQKGPMQEAVLQRWIDDGLLGPQDWVRTEDINAWIRLADIPERFPCSGASSIRCPKCGCIQIAANKKGMDTENACCGALLFGPLGLLCGMTDSNKVIVTCLKCGHQWKKG